MSDLISRQAAIDALKRAEALTRAFGYHNVIETIRELPTAEPMTELYVVGFNDGYEAGKEDAEPRKGKWMQDWKDERGYTHISGYKCTECDALYPWRTNYCPNCGCRMTEGEEDGRE